MNQIEFNSYIMNELLSDRPLSKQELSNHFTSIEENKDILKKQIAKFSPIIEDNVIYLEGVIIIKSNHQVLIDFDYWDDITTLWHYYLNVLEDCLSTGEGECYFPDQPIEIKMIDLQDKISFQVGEVTKIFNKDMFIQQLLSGAKKYYEFTEGVLETDVETELLNRIQQIMKIMENN